MLPCGACQGMLERTSEPEFKTLTFGLHPTTQGSLHVPEGQEYQQESFLTECLDCGSIYKYLITKNGESIVSEETTPSNVGADPAKRKDLLEKVRRLSEEIISIETMKKAALKDYNEQINELKDERQDVLEALKNTPD